MNWVFDALRGITKLWLLKRDFYGSFPLFALPFGRAGYRGRAVHVLEACE